MKAKIGIFLAVALMLTLLPVGALAHTADDPFVTDLTAGGGNPKSAMDVGNVEVWNDGEYLYVKYVVTDGGWCLTETHVQVFLDDFGFTDVPHKNGNPIPGLFTYQSEHDCVADWTYTIPIAWGPGTELLIAAHGVVQTGGLGAALPEKVTMYPHWPGGGFGGPSYFDVEILGDEFLGDTTLDGWYDGYCLDCDHPNSYGVAYVYSSYDPLLPAGLIEHPENLDLVNWIINQHYEGTLSPATGEPYTYCDVQLAIWTLVEDEVSCQCWPESHTQAHVEEILAAAYANGEGFVPGCGDVLGIILAHDPEYGEHQPVIIWIPVPCAEDETAWGGDYFGDPLEFPGKNWAIYFAYTVQDQEPPP